MYTYMNAKMRLEIPSLLEISQAGDKWAVKGLLLASLPRSLIEAVLNLDALPLEVVHDLLAGRGMSATTLTALKWRLIV